MEKHKAEVESIEQRNRLHESVDRTERFKVELAGAEPVMRQQLLDSWKEQLMGQCTKLLGETEDVGSLAHLDTTIALGMDNTERSGNFSKRRR